MQASQLAQVVKNPPTNAGDAGDLGLISGMEDPLEEEMATHCSILALKIPQTEQPGGLQSMGGQQSDTLSTHARTRKHGAQGTLRATALAVFTQHDEEDYSAMER